MNFASFHRSMAPVAGVCSGLVLLPMMQRVASTHARLSEEDEAIVRFMRNYFEEMYALEKS